MTNDDNNAYDMDVYARSLNLSNFLRESPIRSAIKALHPPPGSRGLDVGCGLGNHTLMLAEAVTPDGHVTGLDLSPELLEYAREVADRSILSNNVSFREGDMRQIPFDDDTFDWSWSADCVGYAPVEPLPLIKELGRVVKPGGIVAILAWSSEHLLPGYPLLEARLSATVAGISPFTRGKRPSSHFLRALGWFHEAGLEQPTAQTFIGDVQAPLSENNRAALIDLFEMRWPGVQSELTAEEWGQYQRLCNPQSKEFILDKPDYYAFFTYTQFRGRVV